MKAFHTLLLAFPMNKTVQRKIRRKYFQIFVAVTAVGVVMGENYKPKTRKIYFQATIVHHNGPSLALEPFIYCDAGNLFLNQM